MIELKVESDFSEADRLVSKVLRLQRTSIPLEADDSKTPGDRALDAALGGASGKTKLDKIIDDALK